MIAGFLRTLAPDFCWMTAHELYLMIEQVDEDADYRSVQVMISRLLKMGDLKSRKWPHPTGVGSGRQPLQYLRVSR